MKLEQQVVSLELSKQLKEAGYPQDDSIFVWAFDKDPLYDLPYVCLRENWNDDNQACIAAPTVAELGEKLPKKVNFNDRDYYFLTTWKRSNGEIAVKYKPNYAQSLLPVLIASSEANARAKMWLYLKKEGLLDEQQARLA